ncbi:hypothetical protein [Polyangium jinanense]|uniref:Uncharacterized protein n=1 Tax=Polyangium jinanense TaxID=2829994 RepID=A0A9X3XJV1_9BACT|nr:hypothetical protein [Polyangium jinanense]MDC3962768.1 hypothetical protein [Polyangium jinanense]MDC3989501.1 hypothetical protein [Polyangium jinanense]
MALLLFTPACSGWLRAEGGFTTSTTLARGRQGGSVGLEAAIGGEHDRVALDVALRAKVTEGAGDASLFIGGLRLLRPDPGGLYLLGGVNVLQLGSADGDVSFGMFSPVAEVGLAIDFRNRKTSNRLRLESPEMLTLGTRIEYDLRFTSQPNEGFWTVNLGYALGVAPR